MELVREDIEQEHWVLAQRLPRTAVYRLFSLFLLEALLLASLGEVAKLDEVEKVLKFVSSQTPKPNLSNANCKKAIGLLGKILWFGMCEGREF